MPGEPQPLTGASSGGVRAANPMVAAVNAPAPPLEREAVPGNGAAPVRSPAPTAPSESTRPRRLRRAPAPVDERPIPRRLSRRERRKMGRLRARKVRRVVRHVDPWSVLKLSLLFYLCLFLVVMVAGVLLWSLASSAGTIADIEGFVKDLGAFDSFTFEGPQIFRACALGGLVLVITLTGFNVLVAVLFNLISDLVGGIRVTVIEEESVRRTVV